MIYNNGMPAPGPWDIPVKSSILFQDEVVKIEIPNTANVRVYKMLKIQKKSEKQNISFIIKVVSWLWR